MYIIIYIIYIILYMMSRTFFIRDLLEIFKLIKLKKFEIQGLQINKLS